MEDALANFNLIVSKQVKSWFETHQDIKQRLFMITLAILNGSSFQAVKDASQNLILKVKPPSDEDNNKSEIVEDFFDSRSKLLEEVKAHLVQGIEDTEYGSSSVELIVFNNSQYQPTVLSYIWHEYYNLRTSFLAWLLELGKSPSTEIRNKVAAAIGYLSQLDFSLIRREILLNWAKCSDKNAQISAAIALTVPVWNGLLVSEILGLLHHWSTLNNRYLNRTAIEAYVRGVGIIYPKNALEDLFTIAHSCDIQFSDDIQLFLEVTYVVVSIFNAGQFISSHYMIVLNALNNLSKKSDQRSFKSLFIFWNIMTNSTIKLASEKQELPTLLFLAKADKEHEIIICKLLKRLLNTKGEEHILQKYALKELYNWLKLVDKEQMLFITFARIMSLLFHQGNNQEKGRIIYYLDQWYLKDKSNSAKNILNALTPKKLTTK